MFKLSFRVPFHVNIRIMLSVGPSCTARTSQGEISSMATTPGTIKNGAHFHPHARLRIYDLYELNLANVQMLLD